MTTRLRLPLCSHLMVVSGLGTTPRARASAVLPGWDAPEHPNYLGRLVAHIHIDPSLVDDEAARATCERLIPQYEARMEISR